MLFFLIFVVTNYNRPRNAPPRSPFKEGVVVGSRLWLSVLLRAAERAGLSKFAPFPGSAHAMTDLALAILAQFGQL